MSDEVGPDRECGSCGRVDAGLSPVHRIYVVPEEICLPETEWWCVSCRTHYPHQDA